MMISYHHFTDRPEPDQSLTDAEDMDTDMLQPCTAQRKSPTPLVARCNITTEQSLADNNSLVRENSHSLTRQYHISPPA